MLSAMAEAFFARSPVLIFPLAALVLFIVAFVALSLRTLLRPSTLCHQLAMLPLCDDEDLVDTSDVGETT